MLCKKIKRCGGAEQYHADKKCEEAIAVAARFERLGGVQHACRADASARDRPQELNPHINLFLGRAIARAPPSGLPITQVTSAWTPPHETGK